MARWQDHLAQAEAYWDVAVASNDREHRNQAAANAIHAAINANDALCLYLIGDRPSGQSHAEAPRLLQRACKGSDWEEEAAARSKQLTEILELKHAAEYEGRLLRAQEVDRVMKRTERFLEWVRRVLP